MLEFPISLLPYAKELEATVKDTIFLSLEECEDLKPWQSKAGGDAYLPLNEEFPCRANGQELAFLAQINFSEMPKLHGFPEKGLLQFYIDIRDDLLGQNLNSTGGNCYWFKENDYIDPRLQDGYRILFFENVELEEAKYYRVERHQENTFENPNYQPIDSQYSIRFEQQKQYVTASDYSFDRLSFMKPTIPRSQWELRRDTYIDAYVDAFEQDGTRIGGYPAFVSGDFRLITKPDVITKKRYSQNVEFERRVKPLQEYELLIQFDTPEFEWGIEGIGAFFIRPRDLMKRDFSKVLYNWGSLDPLSILRTA